MNEACCADCRYWEPKRHEKKFPHPKREDEEVSWIGACHRFPPSGGRDADTFPGYWCGEFELALGLGS